MKAAGRHAGLGQRLRRIATYGPTLVLRLVAHRAGLSARRLAFRIALARGSPRRRFLEPAGATRIRFGSASERLRLGLWRIAELVYGGAHPLSSDAWLDLNTGSIFCPVWLRAGLSAGAPGSVLRTSPTSAVADDLACAPFRGDRKIPQDLGRLASLWFLVAADALPPSGIAASAPRARQARFRDYLAAFFAGARSPQHAFWACPMDTGIGATNLLLASEHFVGLDPGSPESRELRALRDEWCALAALYVSLFDERTPVLNNNHHLLNRISSALLAGWIGRRRPFVAAADALNRELAHHFDSDGILNEGSTWYHAFTHEALRFAADVLSASHPAEETVATLREHVARLMDARRHFAAGPELLLVGDADGSIYGPSVALAIDDTSPCGYDRIAIVRRHPQRSADALRAERVPQGVTVFGSAEEVREPEAGARPTITATTHRHGRWTWVTTRLRPVSPATAHDVTAHHLQEFGAIVFASGALKVVVRTLPRPRRNTMGHFHLDLGSVYLGSAEGWACADPGVVTYTGDLALREALRSSRVHPTLIPDERQFVRILGPFSAASAPVAERILRRPGRVAVEHSLADDRYYVFVRARGGAVTVRQATASPRHNAPPWIAPLVSNYGYRS